VNITHLKLSHFPATRSARVLWAIYETANCPVTVDVVNLYGGEQYSTDYLTLNPNHNVPVLEISWNDGTAQTMLESSAMIVFLADAFPAAQIAPRLDAGAARADYLQMLSFGGSWMDMMLWQIRIHEHILPGGERDAKTIARYRSKFVNEVEPQLAMRLDRHAFICGEHFTAADCMIGHNVTWARGYGLCQDGRYRDYLSRLSKREAFQRAFADASSFSLKPPERKGNPSPFSG
jgi:glutathione S-transferase